MAKCKFCGEPVKAAPVFHAVCIEKQLNDMEQDLRLLVSGDVDPCEMCAHCCADGKPVYRPNEEYMAFCDKCDEDYSKFVWRGRNEDS